MSYKIGQFVTVLALKQTGEITSIQNDKIFTVAIGSMKLRCKESEISPAPPNFRRKVKVEETPFSQPRLSNLRNTVDLHGMIVADALREIDSALNRAAMDGTKEVDFIHGIGQGKVRAALLSHLQTIPVVAEVKPNTPNPGVTRVYLRID